MPGLNTLQDDFADGTLNTSLWSGSYGDPTESDGKAHIPCSTGYAGLKSGSAYTLAASSVFLRLHAPDPTGATSAAASVFVLSSVGGTDAGYIVDAAQDALGLYLREGYADGTAVFLTYDNTDHAWLRLRETTGTLYWETSPDGFAWTVRRSAASPAWLADTDLSFLVEGHRDAGPTTAIDLDTVNVPPTLDLVPAGEAHLAQALGLRKTLPLSATSVEETAQALYNAKSWALQASQETHTAVPLALGKHTSLTTALQTDTAPSLSTVKRITLTPARETLTAHVLASPQATEVDFQIGQPYTNWEAGQPW
jgi:hypothetical protein